MTLSSRLQEDLTAAIRDRDELRRDTLRMVIAAVYNARKAARRDLSDDEVVQILTREARTRAESVEAFSAGGRLDAADREKAEIEVIGTYLPEQMDPAELERLVGEAVDESGATSPREMGKVMAVLMPRVRGRADGKQVSALVAQELTRRDLGGHGH